MSDATFPPDYYVSEEAFIEELEGSDFMPHHPEADRHFECDFCSKGINYRSNPRVGMYWADRILDDGSADAQYINEERKLTALAAYCEDCSTRRLLFPCEGYGELRLFTDVDEDRVFKNVRVTDFSDREDGIPWEPDEISRKVTGVPFRANSVFSALTEGESLMWGPENMITFFLTATEGIDIRELIDWKGDIDPKVLGRARNSFDQFRRKMQREGYSREAFRRHVEGNDGE